MADVHDKKTRSFNMSQIKGKNTKPEILVRKFLFSKGFRFLLHDKRLPGKPDVVLPKHNTVINVHGCFWHGHAGCRYFVVPKTRTKWWLDKISRNKQLDRINSGKLTRDGWSVLKVFECELMPRRRDRTLNKILKFI
jgi:DNA mismatch endonuclease (patch repair protein)